MSGLTIRTLAFVLALLLAVPLRAQLVTNFWVAPADDSPSSNPANWSESRLPNFGDVVMVGTNQFGPGTGGSNSSMILDHNLECWKLVVSNYTKRILLTNARTVIVSNNVELVRPTDTLIFNNALDYLTLRMWGDRLYSDQRHFHTIDFRGSGTITFGPTATSLVNRVFAAYSNNFTHIEGGAQFAWSAHTDRQLGFRTRITAMGGTLSTPTGHTAYAFFWVPTAAGNQVIDALPGSTLNVSHFMSNPGAPVNGPLTQDWGKFGRDGVTIENLIWYAGPAKAGDAPWAHVITNDFSAPGLALGFVQSGGNWIQALHITNATVAIANWASGLQPAVPAGSTLRIANSTFTFTCGAVDDRLGLALSGFVASNATINVLMATEFHATNGFVFSGPVLMTFTNLAAGTVVRLGDISGTNRTVSGEVRFVGSDRMRAAFLRTNWFGTITINGPSVELIDTELRTLRLNLLSGVLDVSNTVTITTQSGAIQTGGHFIPRSSTWVYSGSQTNSFTNLFNRLVRTGITLTDTGAAISVAGSITFTGSPGSPVIWRTIDDAPATFTLSNPGYAWFVQPFNLTFSGRAFYLYRMYPSSNVFGVVVRPTREPRLFGTGEL